MAETSMLERTAQKIIGPTPAGAGEPAKVPEPLRPAVIGQNFGLEEFKARTWRVDLDEKQTIEQAMAPDFWRHVADTVMGHDGRKGRGDFIRIWKDDTKEFAECLIVEVGKGYIKLKQLRSVDADAVTISKSSPLTTKWNVGRRAHDVVRVLDNAVISSGFQSKRAAAEWIENHLKNVTG